MVQGRTSHQCLAKIRAISTSGLPWYLISRDSTRTSIAVHQVGRQENGRFSEYPVV